MTSRETQAEPLWAVAPGSVYYAAKRDGKVVYEAAQETKL